MNLFEKIKFFLKLAKYFDIACYTLKKMMTQKNTRLLHNVRSGSLCRCFNISAAVKSCWSCPNSSPCVLDSAALRTWTGSPLTCPGLL